MRGTKTTNGYARELPDYARIPKAVLAAIAVSFAMRLEGESVNVAQIIAEEWRILHQNGIVPQPPLKGKGGRRPNFQQEAKCKQKP